MLQNLTALQGYVPYLLPLPAAWIAYFVLRWRMESSSRATRAAAREAGLDQPPSLHPIIDPKLCIGCGACIHVCPEGEVLGLINGKAELIEAASCIGHGACKTACPAGAISLVFGTEQRGFDMPMLTPGFETNVPGIFVAGELGGMGLIANAIEQGRQAVASISKLDGLKRKDRYDMVIIGAGPAGFAASLAAKKQGLSAVTLEQDTLGGTVAHYPRGKIVMTRPATLPLYGRVRLRKVGKEKLLGLWKSVAKRTGVKIRYGERVEGIRREGNGFVVVSRNERYEARAVLLAVGRRGSPRELGVPGEELPKVVYHLADAAQYRGKKVLVVGGGDSALEAAVDLASQPDVKITLSYRGAQFARAKMDNRAAIDAAERGGRLRVLRGSVVTAIHQDHAEIDWQGKAYRLANDAVIVCAGGILPTELLTAAGVEVETKWGTA